MASLCGCCFSGVNADGERRPLLQPAGSTQPTTTRSARQTRPAPTDTAATRSGRLELRRVGVAELDQRFSDAAETFNEQREHYQALARRVAHLRQSYGCNHDNTLLLSECVKKISDEHGLHYRITLQMKGYDFHLSAAPVESGAGDRDHQPPPQRLLAAQDALRAVSQAAKTTVSLGTKLQELMGWLLRSEERLAGQVAQGAPNHQEQQRLEENLRTCVREMRRGRELSLGYKQRAGEVLVEAAQLAGVQP